MRREQSEHSALLFFFPLISFYDKNRGRKQDMVLVNYNQCMCWDSSDFKNRVERGKREKMRWTSVSEASGRAV